MPAHPKEDIESKCGGWVFYRVEGFPPYPLPSDDKTFVIPCMELIMAMVEDTPKIRSLPETEKIAASISSIRRHAPDDILAECDEYFISLDHQHSQNEHRRHI